ncbi:MAG: hypothetical protein JNN02_06520 [Tabrizicola sp.]|nr:hypothetical protein [Tabrizicola sp.]
MVNSTTALLRSTVDGLGLGWFFRPSIARGVETGRIETMRAEHVLEHPGHCLDFPRSGAKPASFRDLVEFMKVWAMRLLEQGPAGRMLHNLCTL